MALRPRVPRLSKALDLPPDRRLLKKRYALGEEIGEGTGVFRAWDAQLGRPVLVKQVRGSKRSVRLLREVSLLERLCHPFIPALLDYFEDADGVFSLVEEWLPGTPMGQQRRFTLAEVVDIGLSLCEVLGYLHELRIIHRDIKPDNILLQPFSLLDFDYAAHINAPREKGGSPGYVAPEQRSQGIIHPEADVYSTAMLLGCALTDSQPEEVMQIRSFSGLWNDPCSIPDEERLLLDVLDRAIARRPAARPTLAELQGVLSQVDLS